MEPRRGAPGGGRHKLTGLSALNAYACVRSNRDLLVRHVDWGHWRPGGDCRDIFWPLLRSATVTASTGSSWALHCRLDLVAGSADLPGAHQVATLHGEQQCLRRPGRFGVDLLCQCPYAHKLVGNWPGPQDRAVQGGPQLSQGQSEFVTRRLWIWRRLTPGLILEELRDSSPIARPEQSILGIGGVLLSCNPSALSRQAGSVMVPVRLKTEWFSPTFPGEVPHMTTISQPRGHRPGYKVIRAATIDPNSPTRSPLHRRASRPAARGGSRRVLVRLGLAVIEWRGSDRSW